VPYRIFCMKKKPQTITEFANMGGRAILRKLGKRQLRAWRKLGGRPRKKVKANKKRQAAP